MEGLFQPAFITALLAGAITAGVPLLLAGLGEQMSEKAGVLNVGIEGMMLGGAYAGFLAAILTGSVWLGLAAGTLGGGLVAVPMVILCVRRGLNQIVIGIGLTLGLEGLTAILHHVQFSRSYPRLPGVETLAIPGLSKIPIIGSALFDRHPSVYLAFLAVPALTYIYRHSNFGLSLRAAGDKPAALDVTGVDVVTTRSIAVLFTGIFTGIGGAFLANIGAGIFVPFMTHGDGFIGIVLAMLARGRPLWVVVGAMIFGGCLSLTTAFQVAGVNLPTDVIQMLPFATVMIVLVIFGRRASLPAALGVPYVRGER